MIRTPLLTNLTTLESFVLFVLNLTLLILSGFFSSINADAAETAAPISPAKTSIVEPFETHLAQTRPEQGNRRPPREAVDACHSKEVKAACSFAGRDGTKLEGLCEGAPNGGKGPLACRPAGRPPKS